MKRILLALTMVGLLLPFAPRAEADPENSLNFFYDNLADQGSWLEVADYGYVFQPSVAVSSSDWRPYSDGYWAYTDAGWTWVSYEDFGWATYHYGRWANLDGYGWVWVPGYEWGPAWVSWRTGGDYVGWAPLPPEDGGVVYEGRAITGNVDVSFGIGPLYYNFIDIRYIGEPVLRGRLIEPSRNVTIINNTVNVTNITVNNTTVINNGPDLTRVNQFSTRPIPRLTLQRETNINSEVAGHRGNLNRVNGNTLMVAAPAVQRSPQKITPRQVKAKVDKPNFEKGWKGINNRQQVEQAMEKENAKKVPPPTFQPQGGRGDAAGNAGNAGNAGRAEQSAAQQDQQNDRPQRAQQAEGPRTERAQQVQESNAQRSQQDQQQNEQRRQRIEQRKAQLEQQSLQSDQQKPQRSQKRQEQTPGAEAQPPDRAQRGIEQAQESQRAERSQRAEQAQRPSPQQQQQQQQQRQRMERAQQAQQQQQERQQRAAQQRQEAQRAQPPQRPVRAQPPQENRRPEQTGSREQQPQQPSNQNPNDPKNKKKRPADEPTPQS